MSSGEPEKTLSLGLRAGELVEVLSAEEILATLDESGRLEGLPFMPEMLKYAGQRFAVQSRAHKSCDSAFGSGYRSLPRSVFLRELRCDGASHGGCQAECLLFWKDAWLRRVDQNAPESAPAEPGDGADSQVAALNAATSGQIDNGSGELRYFCQATEIRAATTRLPWWEPRQYAEDLTSGNVTPFQLARGLLVVILNKFQAASRRFLPPRARIRRGSPYPFVVGRLDEGTPAGKLDLQPGELVRVKSKQEIERTLDRRNRNRGLLFDGVMAHYCGHTARVRARVTKIINEQTGEMRRIGTDCVMLEGMVCVGAYMQFCQRRIYDYWREIWLERVEPETSDEEAG